MKFGFHVSWFRLVSWWVGWLLRVIVSSTLLFQLGYMSFESGVFSPQLRALCFRAFVISVTSLSGTFGINPSKNCPSNLGQTLGLVGFKFPSPVRLFPFVEGRPFQS
eukprot:m.213894 g.213894  ORF g.213894 m.213894 type:complete len:107 (+) comp33163_c1_seq2:601-921(+)